MNSLRECAALAMQGNPLGQLPVCQRSWRGGAKLEAQREFLVGLASARPARGSPRGLTSLSGRSLVAAAPEHNEPLLWMVFLPACFETRTH